MTEVLVGAVEKRIGQTYGEQSATKDTCAIEQALAEVAGSDGVVERGLLVVATEGGLEGIAEGAS